MAAASEGRYWLLVGGVPAGPFAAEELLARLARGEATPDCLVCPVGGASWEPVKHQAPLGGTPLPPPVPAAAAPAAPVPGGVDTPSPNRVTAAHLTQALTPWVRRLLASPVLLVAGVGLLAYLAVSFVVRPGGNGPREVCARFCAARTAPEVRDITTPNLHPILAELFRLPSAGDEGKCQLTESSPAPREVGGYFVGFHIQDADDAGNPTTIEGVFHVRDQGGWKVDDVIFLSMNQGPLERPVSMAQDYWPLINKPAPFRAGGRASVAVCRAAEEWFADPQRRGQLRKAQANAARLNAKGWMVVVLVFGAVAGGFRKKRGAAAVASR